MNSKILEGLNKEQIEAVQFRDGPCLLVAGPGSGKTTVLTRRVASLIESGVAPHRILLLTFTRSASQNMIERAKRLTPLAADVVGGTFHSIAHRLIKENAGIFKLPENPSIIDPSDVNTVFKRLFAERAGKTENMPPFKTIAKAVSYSVNTQIPLDDVVYERHSDYAYALAFIRDIAADYKAYKRERMLLDYDDLLALWVKMLEHPIVGKSIRERFDYILVDEHQDSNALQCKIIDGLGSNVMAVGDPAQSIYAFRGSAPRTMFAFLEAHENVRVIQLNTNYRSSAEIVDVANAIDAMMNERFDRTLVSNTGATGRLPEMVSVMNGFDEARLVAERVLEAKSNGTPLSEQAVLVRSTFAARLIEIEMTSRRIPYKMVGGLKIHEAKHVKDWLSVVRCAVNQLDEPAWNRALTMAKGVGEKKAIAIFNAVRGGGLLVADPTEIALKMTKNNEDVRVILDAWKALLGDGDPVLQLERSLTLMEPLFLNEYKASEWNYRKKDIEALIAMGEGHQSLDSFITMLTLDLSVDKMNEAAEMDDTERPLTISTVHSAKGLEWDIVFIPQFVQGHMPSMMAKDAQELEEEKRILFVAMTRPRKQLIVTRPRMDVKGVLAMDSKFAAPIVENFKSDRHVSSWKSPDFDLRFDPSADIHIDPFDF